MPRSRGLTLIEVVIVLVALILLAAIVTPQFSRAGQDERLNTLKTDLLQVRAQIRLYRTQHDDRYPQLERFVEQMTGHTRADGSTHDVKTPEYRFGPYLNSVPVNPFTNGSSIGDGPVGTSDWHYDSATGLFRANHDPAFLAY